MSELAADEGWYDTSTSPGMGSVTVQLEGMGTMAGPPARRRMMFEVGKATAREQKAAAKNVVEERIAVSDRVD